MTDAIIAPVGHNGGPPLEESPRPRHRTIRTQWAKALFAHPKTPDHVIAMCWAIHWYSKDDGSGAALSNEQFTAMCGVSDRNVSRGKAWLLANGFVTIRVGRSGQKTTFQMTVPEAVSQPEEVNSIRQCGGLEPKQPANMAASTRQDGALEPANVAALENSIRQNMEANPPIRRPVGRQDGALIQESTQEIIQEKNKSAAADDFGDAVRDEPTPKPQPKTGSKQSFWKQALNPEDHVGVELTGDGRLTLVNGTRVEWLRHFQEDELMLDLALKEIAAEIQPNSTIPLQAQVERKLAIIVRRRKEQDSRYEKGVERNSKARTKVADEDATDIAMRSLRAAVERKNARAGGRS